MIPEGKYRTLGVVDTSLDNRERVSFGLRHIRRREQTFWFHRELCDRLRRSLAPLLPRHEISRFDLPLFDSLIQRLQHARIHRRDDIHCRIQLFLRHPRFPCVRKAPFYSWVAQSHHRHGETDEHLLAVS